MNKQSYVVTLMAARKVVGFSLQGVETSPVLALDVLQHIEQYAGENDLQKTRALIKSILENNRIPSQDVCEAARNEVQQMLDQQQGDVDEDDENDAQRLLH